MPPRTVAPANTTVNHAATPYALTLLSEYAHTLDSIPLDLSRNFADLRELDAVLSSSMAYINTKVARLIEMIETKTATREERLWLLGEIADEAAKVKSGSGDKIRIACLAADGLRSSYHHMTTLLTNLPNFEPNMLVRKTTYPHVAPRSFLFPPPDTGRRRRAANSGGLLLGSTESSPNKRRRVVEDEEYGVGKTPRRDRHTDSINPQPRPFRANQRKKVERAMSPAESVASAASYLHGQAVPPTAGTSRNNGGSRTAQGTSTGSKRRPAAQTQNADSSSLLDSVLSRKEQHEMAPSSSTSHPSLPQADSSIHNNAAHAHPDRSHSAGAHHGGGGGGGGGGKGSKNGLAAANWQPPMHLEGPGVPPPRASTQSSLTTNLTALEGSPAPTTATGAQGGGASVDDGEREDGDVEGEDTKRYCICGGVSFGEMIACDDRNCEGEWFHLSCLGIPVPDGKWFCDACQAKRASRRTSRGGKKRTGGRAGGRGATAA
ncbi:hypothetical protein BD410DRAFT_724971 [Rickenella mellea]|uniref:Chromatin modification-related protein n=1 Tax=Rickenella mellea TaxID=50990 RepID=A0A4Y7Q150_9AGAM|nr:hypothetical protein BD410DRAFT_724971 [Rickenella mellea]